MFIKSISIKKLFGLFDYNLDFKDEINIITAPNGYGKTICLKIIHSLFTYDYLYYFSLDFSEIIFETESGTLKISKYIFKEEVNKKKRFTQKHSLDEEFFYFEDNIIIENNENDEIDENYRPFNLRFNFEGYEHILSESKFKRQLISILSEISNLRKAGRNEWINIKTREISGFEQLIKELDLTKPIRNFLPEWLGNFSTGHTSYFIQDQRLLKRINKSPHKNLNSYVQAIDTYAKELKNHLIQSNLDFSVISQDLDSTFPQRLLSKDNRNKNVSKEKIVEELNKVQGNREKLKKFDILPKNTSVDSLITAKNIDDIYVSVLNLYLNDTKLKLQKFDDIYKKINLFSNILNTKLSFKRIKIDSEKGFYFIRQIESNIDYEKEHILNLSQLSSGEQHQVVLIYELIFNTKEDSIVLIDEPEISLHVVWQEQFLDDLKMITEMNKAKAIIATHSPQIIGDYWDLVIDLEEIRKFGL